MDGEQADQVSGSATETVAYDATPRGRGLLLWQGKQPPGPATVPVVRLAEIFDPRSELPLAQLDIEQHTPQSPDSFLDQAVPNCLYYGDNRETLAYLLANGWRGLVRMVYIDPPFGTGVDYVRKVRLRGADGRVIGQSAEYRDAWVGDSYLQFMYERFFLLRELLAEDGSIWLHCDYRQNHRLRLLLEEVFGEENYLNTISWRSQVARGAKVNAFYFPFSTQYIEIFAKNRQAPTLWNPQKKRLTFSRDEAASQFMEDERGFFRTSDPGTYSFERLKQLHQRGRLYAPYSGEIVIDEENRRVFASKGGNIGVKYYLTRIRRDRYAVERGVDNLWDDVPGLGVTPGEDIGYPTQKTEALLARHRRAEARRHGAGLLCGLWHQPRWRTRWGGAGSDATSATAPSRRRGAFAARRAGSGTGFRRLPRNEAGAALHSPQAEVTVRRSDEVAGQIEIGVLDYRPAGRDAGSHRAG